MFTGDDTEGLKKALEYETLQEQYNKLQQLFNEISEKNTALQSETETTKSELNTLKTQTETTESSKRELEIKCASLANQEKQLRDIIDNTFQQLNEKRDALQRAHTDLSELRLKLTQTTVDADTIRSNVSKITDEKNELERKYAFSVKRETEINERLLSVQRDYDNFRKDNETDRIKCEEQIHYLRKEKDTASDYAEELRLQLEHSKQSVVDLESKYNQVVAERDQIIINMASTSKAYKELLALYEEHVAHNDENVSKLESELTAVTAEKDGLQARYSSLERSLEEERELRRAQLQQFTGAPDDTANNKSSSNLLDLIRDYQKLNRHPEDIYQDFFELREKYQKVLSNATQASNVAETMTRKLNENQNLFNRLYRELEDSKSKSKKLAHTLSAEEAKRSELEKSNKSLKNAVSDLTDEKKNLEASLNDTTYQLQYLLSDVQRRNAPIPSALRESADLLTAVQVSPNIPHDQLVFKDVAELQDLNTKLVYEVRTLREQVKSTSNEISHANTKRNSDIEFYKNALNEAKQTITSLSSTSEDLKKQLNTLTTECTNYKNLISQLGDGDVNTKFEQIQHRQELQRKEMDITFESYCAETTTEINKLKEELSTARASANEAKTQLTQVNVEIANLRRKQINLSSRLEQREKELQSCQRENHNLQECIESRDLELSNTKSELIDFKKRTDRLYDENISLNSRLEATTAAYNATKETMGSQSINHSHMNSLLETINHRMEVFADTSSENAKQYKDIIEKLNRDLHHARDCLSIAEKELDGYKSIDQQEIKDKYNKSVIEIGLLKTKISDLEKQVSNINQDRIIAQTKLATAEEQIKALTATIEGTSASSDDSSSSDSTTCNEHLRLLAQAEDRIRTLESDIESYHTVITSNEKKIELLAKERADMATQNQEAIDKLLKELEIKTAAVDIVQTEADKSIAEYKTLHEKVLSTQAELIQEKTELQERIQLLDTENTAKENELQVQRQVVKEKTSALNEVEGKLDAQIKTTEEYRQTIITLRADVSNLTFEITEYKSKAEAATANVESVTANYKREAADWAEFEDNLKKNLAESEKQREELVNKVEALVKKYDEWQSSVNNDANVDSTAFDGATTDIIHQLRDANKLLRIERDANESKYRYEHDNLKRAEAEMDRVKTQVEYLQTDCERLRQETKSFNQKHSAETEDCKMRCDAFMSQNHKLTQENKRLKEREEKAQAELEKKSAELDPLMNKVSALEAQLKLTQEENEMLNKSQQEWSSRSAQLLSKYNRIDPAEIDRVKSELETTKKELETVKEEKVALEKNLEDIQAQAKKFETERASLVTRSNDRGRLAFEFKKKFMEAEKKFTESEKKLSESEKKLSEFETKLEESENRLKLAETASVTASAQINNNSKAVKEKETLEEEKKKAEESLKTRMDEYTALEKKYNSILHRARQLQQEKIKSVEELKTLRAESPTLKAKIAELEAELANVNKTLTDNSIELTRLKAQNSMIVNKNNRLQKELDVIKAQASSSALSAAASALQASSPMAESPSASPIINTPIQDVSSSPVQITTNNIETAVITTPPAPEIEESAVATPATEADVDIEELNGTPVAELEDTLDEEEEVTNDEVTEDIAATEVTEEVSEAPAANESASTEVEVITETVSAEVGEIAAIKEEESTAEFTETSTTHVEEELAETNQDSTAVIGEKREREEDEEGEVSSPPTKKTEV